MKKVLTFSLLPVLLGLLSFGLTAQTRKPKTVKKTKPVVVATPQPSPEPSPVAETPVKRNERPTAETTTGGGTRSNNRAAAYSPVYFYEFTRPGFTYSRVVIEHDEAGKGKISFLKDGFDDMLTDPVELSAATMTALKGAFDALNFLDSTENYQYAARDFSNMGKVTLTVKKNGRERTVAFNWTENKAAKVLMDEYRRIGNEYTWKFEMAIARVNQPLQSPGLMDALDSFLQRGEISDPLHFVPYLTQLSNDERIPLMARNHATKLIKQIEKAKK